MTRIWVGSTAGDGTLVTRLRVLLIAAFASEPSHYHAHGNANAAAPHDKKVHTRSIAGDVTDAPTFGGQSESSRARAAWVTPPGCGGSVHAWSSPPPFEHPVFGR